MKKTKETIFVIKYEYTFPNDTPSQKEIILVRKSEKACRKFMKHFNPYAIVLSIEGF